MSETIETDQFDLSTWEKASLDPFHKLEVAMNYLISEELDVDTEKTLQEFQTIMQLLQEEFKKEGTLFLPWVRFFDVIGHAQQILFELEPSMKEKVETLVLNLLTQDSTIKAIDWRIAKKILSVSHIFPPEKKSRLLSSISKEDLLKAFQQELKTASDNMVWLRSTSLTRTAKEALKKLQDCFNDKAFHDYLIQALITGRFDKTVFGLSHTLICGEDGGLVLLLNRLSKEQQEDMVLGNIVTKEYLNDKIKNDEKKGESTNDRVVIGQGGFGIVRFGLNLFRGSKVGPGEIICIKKSKSLTHIARENSESEWTDLDEEDKNNAIIPAATDIVGSTLDDYFGSSVAEKVYAPHLFDMTIVAGSLLTSEKEKDDVADHRKGYTMMEIVPQNSAAAIFADAKYQLWKYQKPYLIDVLETTEKLLNERIAFIDLKPDNTLYDSDLFQTSMIDMGSALKLFSTDAPENFDKQKIGQTTPGYEPPEFDKTTDPPTVSIPQGLAYTCGKVIHNVAGESTDYNTEEIKALVDKLTHPEPAQRMPIKDAIDRLKQMGDDSYKEDVVLSHYIAKVKENIENNRSAISLNEDIHQTKELHINQNVTLLDPEKHKDLKTEDLFKKIGGFLIPDQKQHKVMVIFGSAGSGKSIALQLKFIEAVRNWKSGQPLPIYFNLANGIELETILNSMNRVLGTRVTFQDLQKKGAHLYIDSFDEGLGMESGRRETLIQEFMEKLLPPNSEVDATIEVKFIISCRTEYLGSESNYKWFTPRPNALDKLLAVYIVPIDYGGFLSLGKVKELIEIYAKHKLKGDKDFNNSSGFVEKALSKVWLWCLRDMMTTGFMFYVIMEMLSESREEKEESKDGEHVRRRVSKQDIFRQYVGYYQERELKRLNQEQKNQLLQLTHFILDKKEPEEEKKSHDEDEDLKGKLLTTLNEIGKYIAVQLHLWDKFRIDQDDHLIKALGYEGATYFKKQPLGH